MAVEPRTLRGGFAAAAIALLLAGCAGPIAQSSFDDVNAITKAKTGRQPAWISNDEAADKARSRVETLLAQPLTVDDAVEIAMLNNRALQVDLSELGLAAADLAQAYRLPNPGFSFKRLESAGVVDIERKFTLSVVDVLFMPLRIDIEQNRLTVAKLNTANAVLRIAAETRRAYYRAIAAGQVADYVMQVREATAASAELARRMARVGNFNTLDFAREQAFHADATAQTGVARRAATSEREKLTRLLGLWGPNTAFKLPPRLPDLPAQPVDVADVEATTVRDRLDIKAGRAAIDSLATSLGLTRATGFVNVLDASYIRETGGGARSTGYEISLEIPIFDWGDAKVARAEYLYQQAAHRLAGTAVNARSEAREAYINYRTALDLAIAYRDEVVPLRTRISEEMQLRYNGMLSSVFELLIDAQAQIRSVIAAIDAQRDFWIADTDLQFVTIADAGMSAGGGLRLAGADAGGD